MDRLSVGSQFRYPTSTLGDPFGDHTVTFLGLHLTLVAVLKDLSNIFSRYFTWLNWQACHSSNNLELVKSYLLQVWQLASHSMPL